ncbi:MAG TPA: hypothetical protein VF901_14510 [Bradyrhizobium sp.]
MRFMVIVKANPDTEAGKMPSTEMLAAMGPVIPGRCGASNPESIGPQRLLMNGFRACASRRIPE